MPGIVLLTIGFGLDRNVDIHHRIWGKEGELVGVHLHVEARFQRLVGRGWQPGSRALPDTRHQLGRVLQVVRQIWRYGRLNGVLDQGVAGREPAPKEDVRQGPAQRSPVEGGDVKKTVRPSQSGDGPMGG